MPRKKILAYILLVFIAIIAGLSVFKMSGKVARFLGDIFNHSFDSHPIQFVYLGVLATICALVTHRFLLKKGVIVLIVLIYVGTLLLYLRHYFYVYQKHPDFGDMQNVPECLKESNFATFWEFLNHGCHWSLGELVRTLSFMSITWIVLFMLTCALLNRSKKMRNKRANEELID